MHFIASPHYNCPLKKIVTVPILEILNSVPSLSLKFCTFGIFTKSQLCQIKTPFPYAYALIFRLLCLYKKSRINSKGMDTSAIIMNSLMDVIKERNGSFSALDNGGSQLRNEIFQNIKRTVMPLPKR
jgi:hypothetical protein